MTDNDNLATEALVAASVARAEGHLETSDAFLNMARQLQTFARTSTKNIAPLPLSATESNR